MRGLVVAIALCAACVRSNEVVCSDGRICPPGNTCDVANQRCLSPEQVAACSGHAEGDPCTLATVDGVCHGGACEPLVCGDGVRTGTELCDGTDLGGADCTTAGFYEPAGLACTPFCTFDTSGCKGFCGDGVVDGPELCDGAPPQASCMDEGFDAGALQCSSSCGASFVSCGQFGWKPELTGVAMQQGLTGTSSSDLWVAGINGSDGVVGHWDGTSWSISTTAPSKLLSSVSEAANGDVWALGLSIVLHRSAGQWSTVTDVPAATYKDVNAISPTFVVIATTTGVLAWDGSTWSTVGTLAASVTNVRGTSASDLWAVQTDGTLQHWDGTSWQPATLANVLVRRIAVRGAGDVWVAGANTQAVGNITAHWNGTAWTTSADTLTASPLAILPLAVNDVWVAYNNAALRHYDGLRWTTMYGTTANAEALEMMLAFPGELDAVSFDGIAYRYRGQLYARTGGDAGEVSMVFAGWSDTSDDVYVGDAAGNVLFYSDSGWTTTQVATTPLGALWGSGPSDVWALTKPTGGGNVYRFHDATTGWTQVASISGMAAIWGSGPGDVWLVGSSVMHYDGSSFTSSLAVGAQLVTGTATDDVWAVANQLGSPGSDFYHWDGTTWAGPMHITQTVSAVVAVAKDSLYATTGGNHVLHYDGSTWSDTQLLVFDNLMFATASATDDVYVASQTAIFQFDGSQWNPVRATSDVAVGGQVLGGVLAHRGYIDFEYWSNTNTIQLRQLVRTRPWNCRVKETDCDDGIDDDCDGKVDHLDPDCPP